jgi:hypothetical protein
MAIIENLFWGEIHGKCGGVVFRQLGDKTILQACPMKGIKKRSTTKQKIWRDKFREIAKKVKSIKCDPIQRAEYAAKCPPNQSLHTFIVSELMKEKEKT